MAGNSPDRVVFDTSNIVSFILAKNIDYIIDLKFKHDIATYTCRQQLEEINRVLAYPKFKSKFVIERHEYTAFFEKYCEIVVVDERYDRIPDLKDNYIIDLAHTAKSHYIVSRDVHLLQQKHIRWGKIQIVGITYFKALIQQK
jgi:uncharacterized protein